MRIAVIDDEKYARIELCHHIKECLPQAQITELSNGVEALERIANLKFDILFIDIELGDLQGTTVARYAKKVMPDVKIIFATAFSEYAVKAFELEAYDYLLKPIDPDRIKYILEKCVEPASKTEMTEPSRLAVNTDRLTSLIDVKDISHIVTDGKGRGCYIYTVLDQKYHDARSLLDFENLLSGHNFYRIHKRYLVNLGLIKDIFPWKNNSFALRMCSTEDILPIARDKNKQLREVLQIK